MSTTTFVLIYALMAALCFASIWFELIKESIEDRALAFPDFENADGPSYQKYFVIGMLLSGIGIVIMSWGSVPVWVSLLMLVYFLLCNKATKFFAVGFALMFYAIIVLFINLSLNLRDHIKESCKNESFWIKFKRWCIKRVC